MKRTAATSAAALLILAMIHTAVCAQAQTAGPFPEIPLGGAPGQTHVVAYASMLAGAGLVVESFDLAHRANQAYDGYSAGTDPRELEKLYDRTVHYDHLSSGALITGEVLVAMGIYLRFLRRPASSRLGLSLESRRCVLALRF